MLIFPLNEIKHSYFCSQKFLDKSSFYLIRDNVKKRCSYPITVPLQMQLKKMQFSFHRATPRAEGMVSSGFFCGCSDVLTQV